MLARDKQLFWGMRLLAIFKLVVPPLQQGFITYFDNARHVAISKMREELQSIDIEAPIADGAVQNY